MKQFARNAALVLLVATVCFAPLTMARAISQKKSAPRSNRTPTPQPVPSQPPAQTAQPHATVPRPPEEAIKLTLSFPEAVSRLSEVVWKASMEYTLKDPKDPCRRYNIKFHGVGERRITSGIYLDLNEVIERADCSLEAVQEGVRTVMPVKYSLKLDSMEPTAVTVNGH